MGQSPASSPRLLRAIVDADGVALAAIQGLHQMVKEKETEIESLKKRLVALEKLVTLLAEKRGIAAK